MEENIITRKQHLHLILLLILIWSLVLVACSGDATQTVVQEPIVETQPVAAAEEPDAPQDQPIIEPTEPPPPPPPAGRKAATILFTQEFDTLNPLYTSIYSSAITQQIWNCWAWDYDDQNNLRPVLLKEIPSMENGGISADGTTLTMHLRDDITWSDGTPINAQDFIFTYDMIVSANNTVASVFPYDLITSIEAPDERTVVVRFEQPFAPWPAALWHGLIPKHILQPVYDSQGTIDGSDWGRAPTVGCGPFVFEEWEPGSFARFLANENYWLGRPKLDEIMVRFVVDNAEQAAALKTGEGDMGTYFNRAEIPELINAGAKILPLFSGYNEGWVFFLGGTGHPALQDEVVRQAIAMAFDRFSLSQGSLPGQTTPAVTTWDNTPYVNPEIQAWPYDPQKAKQMLDEAGWVDSDGDGVRDKDGVSLSFTYGTTTDEARKSTQAAAQQQLAEVGIQLVLSTYEADIFFSSYAEGGPAASGKLDIFQYASTTNFPDPHTADWLCEETPSDASPYGINWSGKCDPELEQLFQLEATQADISQRQGTFHQISKLIFDRLYWLGLWQDPDLFGIRSRLLNVKLSGATPYYNVFEWDVSQ